MADTANIDDDVKSTFSSDDGTPHTFNITQLEALVSDDLGTRCTLRKLAEGGYHKAVYDVIIAGEDAVERVVRVAAPDFPVDKLESEVATLKYIATNTSLPVPKIIAWSSDLSNLAGAEYMILEKMPGVCAHDVWKTLKREAKETLVRDVAQCQLALFNLRFSKIGSLYLSDETTFDIGPVVAASFYHTNQGENRFPDFEPLDLTQFRGPFTKTSEYLSSLVQAELYVLKHRHEGVLKDMVGKESKLEAGERVLEMLQDLVMVYPGDIHVGMAHSSESKQPFTLNLNDFALPNIMIDEETGNVLGIIDFEAVTTAPLWWCAGYPWWLSEDEGEDGIEKAELLRLQRVYWDAVKESGALGEEFVNADEQGESFREMADRLTDPNCILRWASTTYEEWIRERLEFAAKSPGVGLRERTMEEDIEHRHGREARLRYEAGLV